MPVYKCVLVQNYNSQEKLCTKDIKLLSVSVCPFYLPKEFLQIFVTVVYIHPKANESTALESINSTVHN